jgi:N utilization substance protein B
MPEIQPQNNLIDRHAIRVLAFKALFALNIYPNQSLLDLKNMLSDNQKLDEYYDVLVNGVVSNFNELDLKYISLITDKWNIDRISNIAKTALRLAIYEIDQRIDIPNKVAISEAVLIMDEFSDDKDKEFVNGVLGKYVK